MFKTLYARVVAVLVCFAIVMAVMFLIVMRQLEMVRSQELHQKLYKTLAAQLVSEHILPQHEDLDPAQVQKIFDRLRVINPRIDVYLLDMQGKILASSGRTKPRHDTVDLRPVRQFLDDSAALPILGDDPTEESRQRVFSAAAVPVNGQANGYLYLVMRGLISDSIAERIHSSYILRESIWIIAWGVLFALLASTLIINIMTRPLRQLTLVMDKFRKSGLSLPPESSVTGTRVATDEITRLTDTFKQMEDRLLDQMRVLQQTDATRRELIANISHDLRTPLASLQGYLETLQVKEDRLSLEEKRNYLDIALRQSEHLGHLVAQLFELAKLDSEQAAILIEPFVLEELVQDIVQQFELNASHRQITLRTDIPDGLPLVAADIGLIERVLRNLLENSLRYTPMGGNISIKLTAGKQRVSVEVADTGCGINAKDLPHIFDRFYRSEESRSGSSGNAGLGLAIAKRIVELHHSSITVRSKPGMTTIAFALPYAHTGSMLPQPGAVKLPQVLTA